MSIYSVNYNTTSVNLLPTHKREENIKNLAYSLMSPMVDLNTIFTYLRTGTSAGDYNALTVYTYGELVNYQRRVYFRNEVTAGYVAGITPNTSEYFVKVLDFTIGLDERIRFTPNKLVLEYALNAIFGTTYSNPPTLSDIYITRNTNDSDAFEVGQVETESSTISQMDIDAQWAIPEFEPDGTIMYDYTVNVPVAVWTALASTPTERDNIVISVLNKYKLVGFVADVQTY